MLEPANKKNIVVCCDGTGNQFGDANSNIVKLYTALIINNEQVGYYHPGVGTMGAPQARTKVEAKLSVWKGLAFASGFMDNVEDAYRYLMETYNDGDQIYLFGFSRGAYTIRALSAILHAYGLLCRGNQGHIPYILRLFNDDMKAAGKESKRHRKQKTGRKKTSLTVHEAFKETYCHDVTVYFVGLYDTVSAVGWISQPLRLLYSAQNPIIQTGRHAISIDERRCFYQDNLWGSALPMDQTPTLRDPQDILQVWFGGVHSDVGGSYPQAESALPNRTLRWLLDEAQAHGLCLEPDRVNLIFGLPTLKRYAAAEFYRMPLEPGCVHPSLHGFGWWFLELLPHRYYTIDDEKQRWRFFPLGRSRTVPKGSVVHPSVVERMENASAKYAPGNLLREDLSPHSGTQSGTIADLKGYFLYKQPPSLS